MRRPNGACVMLRLYRAESAVRKTQLADVIGTGKGAFSSSQEVDQFIRTERDQWT